MLIYSNIHIGDEAGCFTITFDFRTSRYDFHFFFFQVKMTNTRNTIPRQLEDCQNWISTSPKSFKNSIPRETCFPIYVEEVSVETLFFVRNMKYLCRPITLNNWNQLAKPFNGDISILKRLSILAFDGDKPCPVLIQKHFSKKLGIGLTYHYNR